jgi:hypothetical protein
MMTTDELALTIKVAKEALNGFVPPCEGTPPLKGKQTKKATIIKEGASSRVAGYLQSRQGRRPMRVDTLLAKDEKQAKKSCLPKQAALVPSVVTQLALGALHKLAGEEEYDLSVARAARRGRKIVGTTAGGLVGAATGGEIARQVAPKAGIAAPLVYVAAPVAGAATGAALGYGASQLEQAYWDRARRLAREKREAELAEARKAQEIV